MDFAVATMKELKKFIASAEAELAKRQLADKAALVAKMNSMAEAAGFTLEQLVEKPAVAAKEKAKPGKGAAKSDKRGTVAQKYGNPANPAETWTGRGRKPKWVEAFLATGGNMESLLIVHAAEPVAETADAETADAETADAETADAETADAETADAEL